MENNKSTLRYAFTLSFIAALGGFLFGYDTAVISGTILMVAKQFELDTLQQGWYVGCALIGSIGGVSIAGIFSDKFGRKISLFFAAFLFLASAIGCCFSANMNELIFYRIVGGVGIGIASIISPLYISEVAFARYRGTMVTLYQLAITIGFLSAYLVNWGLLSYSAGLQYGVTNDFIYKLFGIELWRGMLGMEALPAFLFLVILFAIPESPRWLLANKKVAKGENILLHIYGGNKVAAGKEIQAIESSLSTPGNKTRYNLLLNPGIIKAICIGVAIAILGQFMGVNAVLYYGPAIFEQSGLSQGDSLFYQVLVGVVNVLTTVLGMLIIDKVGRKKLVYFGVTGMILFLLLISFYFVYGKEMSLSPVFLLICFLVYIFCCAISICTVIFVLLSEMYPTPIRGIAMSIGGFSLWIGTYLIGQLTPWLLEVCTPAGTFMLFALMCVPYILIIRFCVPETTGKSLEEIEKYWIK